MNKGRVIIAGCGYVGKKLAACLKSGHYSIAAIVGSNASRQVIAHEYACYNIDLDKDMPLPRLEYNNAVIFYFIPPPSQGTVDSRIERFLESIQQKQLPRKIVLISTTGVYGNCGDDWVDELRKPAADTDRGKRRLSAEQYLESWCRRMRVDFIILRVPGIYGPDKLPVARIQEKKPVLRLSESPWSNRIHIDDLVQSCINAMNYTGNYTIFNISDGNPSSMSDFFLKVASAMDLPTPQQISLEECKKVFSENMLSYLLESKKINNKRMLNELKVQLKYPTLKQGLAALK